MQTWQLLSVSKTITIHCSESKLFSPIAEYSPHKGLANYAVYNHGGKVIASCGQDGKLAIHNAQKCQQKILELTYHSGNEQPSFINCCSFSPKSRFIAACSVNSTLKIWNLKSNKQKQQPLNFKGHSGGVTTIAWLNNQQLIASGSTSGDILLHDVTLGSIKDNFLFSNRNKSGVNNIKISQGEMHRRLAACTNTGSVYVWDINASNKKQIFIYDDPMKSSFTCLSISSFKPVFMACSTSDSNIVFMDIHDRKVVKIVSTQQPLTTISFSQDGQMLAAGGLNGGLFIYDLRKIQTPLVRLTGHSNPVRNVCFNEKQKNIDIENQRMKVKDKEHGATVYHRNSNGPENGMNTSSDGIKQHKYLSSITYTPKLGTQEEKNNQNKNRISIKKEQNAPMNMNIQQQKTINQTSQLQQTSQSNLNPPVHHQTPAQHQPRFLQNMSSSNITTTSNNFRKNQQISNAQPPQNGTQQQFKNVQQKLIDQMKNMQIRFNEKFQILHLQIIKQMQLSVEKITYWFDKNHHHQKQLQNKIHNLQLENQNLRKKTY